ncbi:MAG: hypothetical protein WA156_00205 [Methylocystis silviterrae]
MTVSFDDRQCLSLNFAEVDSGSRTANLLAMLGVKQGYANMPVIDPDASAILIWLPDGITPSETDFPEGQLWTLEEAAKHASEASKDHSKRPWIKSNGRILGGSEIRQVMCGLKAMGLANAHRP